MILHYLKISLRNLRKYKAQTAISICAMAVSLTLMALVTSFVLSFRPSPLLSQPYADRVEQLAIGSHRHINSETMSLILGHQFKNAEEIHFLGVETYSILPISNSETKEERALISQTTMTDNAFLKFHGIKSALTGKKIDSFSSEEVIISEKLARKLYGKENPVGKKLNVYYYYHPESKTHLDRSYIIKDVMETPSQDDRILYRISEVLTTDDHIPETDHASCYFVLRKGASKEDLTKELKELLPNSDVRLVNVKEKLSDDYTSIIYTCIILFMLLFVLVSFSNYLKQQTQLFRLREREVALRTCFGSQPSSLFALFSTEIMIVLSLTLLLTLAFISITTGFIDYRYEKVFESDDYFTNAVPVALISMAVLIAISLAWVAFTVKRIRMDQTGLALRMKPLPKHRLRNVGLTVQMAVSIFFTGVTVVFFMSIPGLKDYYGIPEEDIDTYKNSLQVRVNGITDEKSKELFDKIESLQSVKSIEKVYKFWVYRMVLTMDQEMGHNIPYHVVYQNGEDWVDFFNIEIENKKEKVNPARYAYVSKDAKQKLIEKNLWNGTTIDLPDVGQYEVKGEIDKIPFYKKNDRQVIVLYDDIQPVNFDNYDRIILPKAGLEKEAMEEVNNVIREVLPARIDIKAESYYNNIAQEYDVISIIISIIYILSAISLVTTMAGVYAGVSLDTRRRRKEMALRKLNGAGRKVIAMIFLRTYIWILAVAGIISLSVSLVVMNMVQWLTFPGLTTGIVSAYVIALLLIIAITAITIAWKIRDIMKVNPVEYLKE